MPWSVNIIPVIDIDKDGLPNSIDQCPTQAETVNGYEDSDGCPDIVPVVEQYNPNKIVFDELTPFIGFKDLKLLYGWVIFNLLFS